MKLAMMHIFLNSYDENEYKAFKEAFQQIYQYGVQGLSVSPIREYGQYGEIYATMQIDENRLHELLDFMSDGWDGPEDDCQTNAFTAKVFDSHVNSLYFQLPDE